MLAEGCPIGKRAEYRAQGRGCAVIVASESLTVGGRIVQG